MRTVYVLVYMQKTVGPDGKEFMAPTPYAVFEDSITAEKMKRDGDEIVKVPYFEEGLREALKAMADREYDKLTNTPVTMTHIGTTPQSNGSTLAPFPPPSYPRVTCNKTVDEHTWRDRSD